MLASHRVAYIEEEKNSSIFITSKPPRYPNPNKWADGSDHGRMSERGDVTNLQGVAAPVAVCRSSTAVGFSLSLARRATP
jgi:hypothetical protein